jgi:spore germination protein PC
MEQLIQQLQIELQETKQRPTTTIEKIEYKFDQLKVETLEGTLNIGLNPNNEELIEDFAVSQKKVSVPEVRHEHRQFVSELETDIAAYLDDECQDDIRKFEQQMNRSLDDSSRVFIIDDIRGQINERIHFYIKQYQDDIQNPTKVDQVHHMITEKVKTDIKNSISAFLHNMPNDMNGGNKT